MRAVTIEAPGGPEALTLTEVPDPQPGRGEVLVEVAAAGVNRADIMQRRGFYPPPTGASPYLGLECSGVIRAVCALLAGGGYAELVAVPAGQLLPVPAGVDLVSAAALPEVVCTVWSNLAMVARLADGEWLLAHGGSSGIGTMAIQVGRQVLGAHIAVTAGSPEKLRRCAELGAEVLVNYREQDFVQEVRSATAGAGANVVLDHMGAVYLGRNVDVLATGGRLVVIGLQGGRTAELDLGQLVAKRAAVYGTGLRARPLAEKEQIVAAVRANVWPAIEAGRVRPVVDRTLPLDAAGAAHEVLERSEHVGKILLRCR
jgi:putative PIG3 family NAD(P)H quinone oxidoreductase